MTETEYEYGNTDDMPIGSLTPFPKQQDIYPTTDVGGLAERMEKHGFREQNRLLVTPDLDADLTILAGHRRWKAAKAIGKETIPVEIMSVEDEQDALLTFLQSNDDRVKTPAEKINEIEEWMLYEREKAFERQSSGGQQAFAEGEKGEAASKAAAKVGLSRETYRKGKTVKYKSRDGNETAAAEWAKLEEDEQTIHRAYKNVKDAETDTADKAGEGAGTDTTSGDTAEERTGNGSSESKSTDTEGDTASGTDTSNAKRNISGGNINPNTESGGDTHKQPGESETEGESEVDVDSPNPDADTEETPDETPTTESPEGVVWDSDETEPISETNGGKETPDPEPDNSPRADGESFPRGVKPDKPEKQATYEIGVLHVDTSTDFIDSAEEFVEKLGQAHGYAGTSIGTKQRRQERILVDLLEVVEVPE